MKRYSITAALTAAVVAVGLAGPPAAQATATFKSAEGITFKFWMSQEINYIFSSDLDFNSGVDTSLSCAGRVSSIVCDDDTGRMIFESRFRLTAEKGRVELSTMIEWDGAVDEQAIDANDPNVERFSLKLKLPEMNSTLLAGAEVVIFDNVARLIGLDDDPGLGLMGGKGNVSWTLWYDHRRENGGDFGGSTAGVAAGKEAVSGDGSDHQFFMAKLEFKGKMAGGSPWMLEPGVIFQSRNKAEGTGTTDQRSGYVWLGGDGTFGWVRLRGEFAYQFGELNARGFTFRDYDISAWAAHASAQLTNLGGGWPLGGVVPFISFDYSSGDDDANDNDLEGFTAISSASSLRWDGIDASNFSVMDAMTSATGCLCIAFGYETALFGGGPTTGGIGEHASGQNPGWWRIMGGLGGRVNDKWETQLRVMHLRYAETNNITPFVAGTSVDEEIGTGVDFFLWYSPQKEMQVGPFVSVFFPGAGLEDINPAMDETGITGGFWFFAAL